MLTNEESEDMIVMYTPEQTPKLPGELLPKSVADTKQAILRIAIEGFVPFDVYVTNSGRRYQHLTSTQKVH